MGRVSIRKHFHPEPVVSLDDEPARLAEMKTEGIHYLPTVTDIEEMRDKISEG